MIFYQFFDKNILNISVLISNIVNVDNYNPHENSLGISIVNKGVLKSKVWKPVQMSWYDTNIRRV